MDSTTGAIGSLLPKLDEMQKSMKKEVAPLKQRLATILIALSDVEKLPVYEVTEPVKRWSREARDLSYDIEHVVDKFRARQLTACQSKADDATAAGRRDIIAKIKYKTDIYNASRQFASDFRGPKGKLNALIMEKPRLLSSINLDGDGDDPVAADLGIRVGSVTGKLAGLHSRVEKLVNILMDEEGTSNQQLKVASILGMPGVGKTTLANQVYKRITRRFECSAWVTVSNKPDVKNVLRNMLSQITPQGDDSFGLTNIQEIINEIKKALKDKRFFIVFDDMCDNKAWEIIKSALVDVRNLSAVLITSSQVSVARYACGIIYHLKSLSNISSKKLLAKRLIIGSGHNFAPQLANIPSRVLQKNSAIPSAIIHAASRNLLGGKAPEDGDTVVETNNGVHVPSSVPPRVGGTRAPEVSSVSIHLKSCLMYLSMFQKGLVIDTERLVWAWIAEGLISREEGTTLQEQGESHISELISLGFLVAIKVDASGNARSCRLRDDEVHHSIASLSAEENSVTIVDGQQVTPLGGASVRRLSIQGNNTLSPQVPLSRVRSLVVSGDANPFHQETGGTNSVLSLSNIVNLSILDLGGCASLKNDHLKGIESLLLLKYLVLGGDCVTGIPGAIGSLVYLQTLDLRASRVEELPESIACARKLECLLVNWYTKIPDAIGKMKALQVLGDINISRGKLLEELPKLQALRVLKIVMWSWDDTCDTELFKYLRSLGSQKIQCLSIFISRPLDFLEKLDADPTTNPHLQELEIRHSTFVTLPKWITSLTKLSSLSIEVHKLSQTVIEILGKLETLGSLFLTSKDAPEVHIARDFINLKRFRIVSSALGKIHVSGGMKDLEWLHLSFQASLTREVNFRLENLSSLKHIHVEIICFNASNRVVQDIEKAITKAMPSGGAELVIVEVRKEDMEKNDDGQEKESKRQVSDLTTFVHGQSKKGSDDESLYKGVKDKFEQYEATFHARKGPDFNPCEEPIDEVALIEAGKDEKHGRLHTLDGGIKPTTTQSQVQTSSMSESSAIIPRGQPGRALLTALEAHMEAQYLEQESLREEQRQAYEAQREAYERIQEQQRIYVEQHQVYQEYCNSYMAAMFSSIANGTLQPSMRPPPAAPRLPLLPLMPQMSTFVGPTTHPWCTPGPSASNDHLGHGSTPTSHSPITPRTGGDSSSHQPFP